MTGRPLPRTSNLGDLSTRSSWYTLRWGPLLPPTPPFLAPLCLTSRVSGWEGRKTIRRLLGLLRFKFTSNHPPILTYKQSHPLIFCRMIVEPVHWTLNWTLNIYESVSPGGNVGTRPRSRTTPDWTHSRHSFSCGPDHLSLPRLLNKICSTSPS